MSDTLTTPVYSVDFTSSIPREALTGRVSSVYATQLDAEAARRRYEVQCEITEEDLRRNSRPGAFVDTTAYLNHPEVVKARTAMEEAQRVAREAQAEIGGVVFCVAEENLPKLTKKLASLTRRGESAGTGSITLTPTDETILLSYKIDNEDTRDYTFLHRFCILKGTTPKIPGFEFLATVTHTDAGNLVKRVPALRALIRKIGGQSQDEEQAQAKLDAIDLSRFRHTGRTCEKCGLERKRIDTYIVYNEATDETKQVGRNCLRDYTGADDPERIVKHLEQVWEVMRRLNERGSESVNTTDTFLAHTAALYRVNGGYRSGLGHDALTNIYDIGKFDYDRGRKIPRWVEPTEYDIHLAGEVRNWAVNEWDETGNFAENVKVAVAASTVDHRTAGLAGAVFVARDKWLQREQRRADQAKADEGKERGFVGQPKGRVRDYTVKLLSVKARVSDYSEDAQTLRFEDEQGNLLVWFASNLPRVPGEPSFPVAEGSYKIDFTVKEHEDSERWGKSTIITRAKFVEVLSVPQRD